MATKAYADITNYVQTAKTPIQNKASSKGLMRDAVRLASRLQEKTLDAHPSQWTAIYVSQEAVELLAKNTVTARAFNEKGLVPCIFFY